MNLKKLILVNNDCYKAGRKITPKGIMVHSTGSNNPNLKRYVGPDDGLLGVNTNNNHWNMSGVGACVHAFIGKLKDGTIATYQTLPWNWRGWHSASGKNGSANNTHISFEICEDNLGSSSYFNAVYKEAVELCAYLCKEYNLTEQDIICHSEGYQKGIASNHGDVMHWFPKHGKSMDTFRADVKTLLNGETEELTMAQYEELNNRINEMSANLTQIINDMDGKIEKLSNPMIYAWVDDNMPEWARATVTKLMQNGYLKGDEDGKLNLTFDMLRIMVILDRAGAFDNK